MKRLYSLFSVTNVTVAFLSVFFIAGCQKKQEAPVVSTTKVNDLVNVLKGHSEYMVFGKENGPSMLITPALGARIMGASVNGVMGDNLLWVNQALYADSFWQKEPDWNAGGFRSWIAPEDAFFLDAQDKWFVPKSMDPGSYKLVSSTSTMAIFQNDFIIKSKESQEYSLKLTREIHLLESYQNPGIQNLPAEINYVGVRVVHSLENTSKVVIGNKVPHVGLWSLLQVKPAGTMIIPLAKSGTKDKAAFREYFNPIPPERMAVSEKAITVKIDGKFRCKIGIAPEFASPAIAFLAEDEGGQGRLYIKQFMVDPKGKYLDHPWGKPSTYGDAVEMYNDDGVMGGFAELECHGPAQTLKPGEKESHDVSLHVFTGPVEALKNIAASILELDFAKLTFYK